MLNQVSILDFVIIFGYLATVLGIGLFYSFRTADSDDFLLGGRRMSSGLLGVSLFVSLLSTISFLAWPGEIIKYGPTILFQLIGYPIALWIIGWILIPIIMRQPVTSAYEILQIRLGSSVRYLASTTFLTIRLLWMAVIVYATTRLAVIPVFDLPESATVWVCIVLGIGTVFHSVLGGFRGVVVTDVVQACVLFSGAIATVAVITYQMGGVQDWLPMAWPGHWQTPRLWFHSNERNAIGFIVSVVAWYVAVAGADQLAIQRYLATRDAKSARQVLAVAMTVQVLVFLLMSIVGLALLGWFAANPNALAAGETVENSADRLFTRFMMEGLPNGVGGLLIAGLLAEGVSSLSAGINACSSVITADFLEGALGWTMSEKGRLRAARLASAGVGVTVVLLAIAISTINSSLYELTMRVSNLMTAPLFVLFFMAFFVRRATPASAWVGGIVSALVAIAISFFPEKHGLGFLWIVPGSLAAGVAAGLLVTQFSGIPNNKIGSMESCKS